MTMTDPQLPVARRFRRVHEFAMTVPNLAKAATAANDDRYARKAEPWQAEAYRFFRDIGELNYVLKIKAKTLAKGRLTIVEKDANGEIVDQETDENGEEIPSEGMKKAMRVLHAWRGPDGNYKTLMYTWLLHKEIAGESILVADPADETKEDSGALWEFLSVLEVVADPNDKDRYIRKKTAAHRARLSVADDGSGTINDYNPDYMTRYHERDLAHSGDPTSVVRSNATVCREIMLLDQLKEVLIKSRLSAGVILVPDEVSLPSSNADEGVEDETTASTWLELFVKHVSAPIEDRGSMASLAPLIVQCPAELIEKWRLLSLADQTLDLVAIQTARNDALGRLAAGLDAPKERMEGLGESTHWNAAAIDIDEVRKHVIPAGDTFAEWSTVRYLQRNLIAFEEMSEDDAVRFEFAYDGSDILSRMDAAASADALYEDDLIDGDTRVEAHGYDPEKVRPSETEIAKKIIRRLAVVPHANNRALLPGIIDFAAVDLPPEVIEFFLANLPVTAPEKPEDDGDDTDEVDEEDEPARGPDVETDEIPGGPDMPATRRDVDTLAVVERIRATASEQLVVALSRAANQVMTNSSKLPPVLRAKVEQVPRSGPRKPSVLPMLSSDDWRAINRAPQTLMNGAFIQLEQQAIIWIRELHIAHGRGAHAADQDARHSAAVLVQDLNRLAMSAFEKPLCRDTTGLVVPRDLVFNCLGVLV